MTDPNLAATVHHSGGSYPVFAGWNILDDLGERLVDVGVRGAAYIITDDNVMNPYGRRVQRSLQAAGIPAHCFIIPAGETSKSFELAQAIYDWLAERRAERGHTIISVGGGVPGDLGGFCGRNVSSRNGLRAGAHQHGSHGRCVHRRKGGHQPASRQEPGRRLLPAQGRPLPTPQHCPRWASASWPRAGPRPSSTGSSWTPSWLTCSRSTPRR